MSNEQVIDGLNTVIYPERTMDEPELHELGEWVYDSLFESADGCIVEHDGVCSHVRSFRPCSGRHPGAYPESCYEN